MQSFIIKKLFKTLSPDCEIFPSESDIVSSKQIRLLITKISHETAKGNYHDILLMICWFSQKFLLKFL